MQLERQVAKILCDVGSDLPALVSSGGRSSWIGDERALRGIPAYGVGGAMLGTRPEREVLKLDRSPADNDFREGLNPPPARRP